MKVASCCRSCLGRARTRGIDLPSGRFLKLLEGGADLGVVPEDCHGYRRGHRPRALPWPQAPSWPGLFSEIIGANLCRVPSAADRASECKGISVPVWHQHGGRRQPRAGLHIWSWLGLGGAWHNDMVSNGGER